MISFATEPSTYFQINSQIVQKEKKHTFASLTAPISTAHKIQIEVDLSNEHRAIVGGSNEALPFREGVFVADVDEGIGLVEIEDADIANRRLKHDV